MSIHKGMLKTDFTPLFTFSRRELLRFYEIKGFCEATFSTVSHMAYQQCHNSQLNHFPQVTGECLFGCLVKCEEIVFNMLFKIYK